MSEEDLPQEPHIPKSSPSPTPSSLSTKTFLMGEPAIPGTVPTPLLPPLLHALPTNTHQDGTAPETFALQTTYLKTSTYSTPTPRRRVGMPHSPLRPLNTVRDPQTGLSRADEDAPDANTTHPT
ncbi:hypothetical protein HOY80DRAFT_1005836 [Tuber brumale]|nr:hypothetical protein HOY80DRAFT_1005836 [Tuber brumale]